MSLLDGVACGESSSSTILRLMDCTTISELLAAVVFEDTAVVFEDTAVVFEVTAVDTAVVFEDTAVFFGIIEDSSASFFFAYFGALDSRDDL